MNVALFLWIGIGFAVVLLVVGVIFSLTDERSYVDERLKRYLEEEEEDYAEANRSSPLTDWINVQVERTSFGERIAKELARADLKLKPHEYIGINILSVLIVAGIGWGVGGEGQITKSIFAVLGAIVGLFLPRLYVKRQQKVRLERFNDQLPDMLNLAVNGLRAGYSTMQALESVSKELPPPISDEFRRVVREMQIGIPMDEALANLLRRIPSDDLDLIVTAINIQREVGGNLAEILDIISYTIRERIRIKREIQVLVSQVLYSGRILALMPVALAIFLWLVNRSYMEGFMLVPACGVTMLVCGGLMIVAGYYMMTRIADIEI